MTFNGLSHNICLWAMWGYLGDDEKADNPYGDVDDDEAPGWDDDDNSIYDDDEPDPDSGHSYLRDY